MFHILLPNHLVQIESTWNELMRDEREIRDQVGDKEMLLLKANRQRYYLLLLETAAVVANLLSQSRVKQNQVRSLQKMARDAMSAGGVVKDGVEKVMFEQKIRGLLQWIDDTKLTSVTEKWSKLINDLEVK